MAKFSKLHYPQLVLEQLVANEGDVAMALRESFHRIDELLEEPVRPQCQWQPDDDDAALLRYPLRCSFLRRMIWCFSVFIDGHA